MNGFAPVAEGKAAPMESAGLRIASFLRRVASAAWGRRSARRLHLCEMLSLGEKRFVAVVEYGADKFILAGTPQSISLLTRIHRSGGAPETPGPAADSEEAPSGRPEKK